MKVIIADFVAKQGQGDKVREILQTQAANSLKNEEACRHFDVCCDPEDNRRYTLYELYDDDAAVEAHRKTDYYAKFRENIDPLVESRQARVWNRL